MVAKLVIIFAHQTFDKTSERKSRSKERERNVTYSRYGKENLVLFLKRKDVQIRPLVLTSTMVKPEYSATSWVSLSAPKLLQLGRKHKLYVII